MEGRDGPDTQFQLPRRSSIREGFEAIKGVRGSICSCGGVDDVDNEVLILVQYSC